MIRILLSPSEIEWTDEHVGRPQRENAIAQQRTPGNDAPNDDETAMWMHIFGGRCEAAAYKWAKPVKWNYFHRSREKKADLHDFIDVKGVEHPWHKLIVTTEGVDRWAYLLVDGSEHPWYEIVSWCWGDEAKTIPLSVGDPARPPCHFVSRTLAMMKSPDDLLVILRRRQSHLCHCGEYGTHTRDYVNWVCNKCEGGITDERSSDVVGVRPAATINP